MSRRYIKRENVKISEKGMELLNIKNLSDKLSLAIASNSKRLGRGEAVEVDGVKVIMVIFSENINTKKEHE